MAKENPNSDGLRNPSGLSSLPPAELRDENIALASSPIGQHLRLFPCKFTYSQGKDQLHPLLGGWSDDSKLTSDPSQIEALWKRYPGAAVATRCDNLVVFDIDRLPGPEGPRTVENPWVSSLSKEELDALRSGLETQTPSLGQHWIFRQSEAWVQSGLQHKDGLFPGVDLAAGSGKVIVLPPSFIEKKAKGYCGRYVFPDYGNLQLPVLPDVLLELIQRMQEKPKKESSLTGILETSETDKLVPEGERRTFLLQKSRYLRGRGLGLDILYTSLLGLRDHRCEPGAHPVSDKEVWDLATSAVEKFDPDKQEEAKSLKILTAAEFKALPPPSYIILEVLPSGVTVLFSNPGAGKSFLSLAIACAIARDKPLLDDAPYQVLRPGHVIVALPEGAASWASRLKAWDAHEPGEEDSPNLHFIMDGVDIIHEPGWKLLLGAFETLTEKAGEVPVLVIIDTLAAATPGANENSVEDMGLVMSRLQGLVSRGANVLLVHHANKTGDFRGHTAISGSCDSMLRLTRGANGVMELGAVKLRDAESVAPCSFEIRTSPFGPVPVKSEKGGPLSQFNDICSAQPGLLEAIKAHGVVDGAGDSESSATPTFSEGVAPRQVNQTWNNIIAPDDRTHRMRRQRILLKALRLLVKNNTLTVHAGNLWAKDSDALDAILKIPESP